MPKEKVEGLLTQLHDRFADSDTSPQQEAMLLQLQSQLAEWEGPKPTDDFTGTAERLLEELEEKHPQATIIIREILETLSRIGI